MERKMLICDGNVSRVGGILLLFFNIFICLWPPSVFFFSESFLLICYNWTGVIINGTSPPPSHLIFFFHVHLKVNSTCFRRNLKQQQVSSWVMIFTGAFTFCLAWHITSSICSSGLAPSSRQGKRTLYDSINRFCYLYLVTVVEHIQFLSSISLLCSVALSAPVVIFKRKESREKLRARHTMRCKAFFDAVHHQPWRNFQLFFYFVPLAQNN